MNIFKNIKKITSVLLIMAMCISVFAQSTVLTKAETTQKMDMSVKALKKAVPSVVRIYPHNQYTYVSQDFTTAFYVPFLTSNNCIANIKTSTKNLIAKVCEETKRVSESNNIGDYSNYSVIGLYATKEGKYKVSFDVLQKKGGKKLYSKTVTVYVKSDSPFKSITYNGKDMYMNPIQTKAKGKLKVKMNKGYTLKSIEVGTYTKTVDKKESDENSKSEEIRYEMTYKKVKNNSTIQLGTKGGYSYNLSTSQYQWDDYKSYSYSCHLNDYILADTCVKVTFVDKYTKKSAIYTYYLQQFSK